VEHPKFTSLYEQELEQEGLPITVGDVDDVPATTVSIFPDEAKDFDRLDIILPVLTAAHEMKPTLEALSIEDVRKAFKPFSPLPLGEKTAAEIKYEGQHLITGEVVEAMKVNLPLLRNGITAISFFVRELEAVCKVQSTHKVLAPLLQIFLGEMLFGEKVSLVDQRLTKRLSDQDVREHIRAVFIPLIRERTVETKKRRAKGEAVSLRNWKPFQATYSENRPVERSAQTLFNLVPCNRSLEVALSQFLDKAPDVAAFAKNAGPQALRIDYLTADQRLAFYTPDFFVRMAGGEYALVETKGRQDSDVPRKARAAVEWCKAASKSGTAWQYVFVPQAIMEGLTGNQFGDLIRACAPALKNLISETTHAPELPLFGEDARQKAEAFFSASTLEKLSPRERKAAEDAAELYRYFEKKTDKPNFAPVFNVLLGPFDQAATNLIIRHLQDKMPGNRQDQDYFFAPYIPNSISRKDRKRYQGLAGNLRRALVFGNVYSVIGVLCACLDFAVNDKSEIDGIFAAVRDGFSFPGVATLNERMRNVNDFRNKYIAHHQRDLTDPFQAKEMLNYWVDTLSWL